MDQFTVPQFIDVEDKIFSFVTVRQFLIMLVSGLIHAVVFKLVDVPTFITFFAIFGGFTLTVAFVKVNGQSFHYFLLNLFQTVRRPSLRIWNKRLTDEELQELRRPIKIDEQEHFEVKHATVTRIRDLSLLVNTGGYYKPE